ncbi:substrate-binding periplasmic protein [Aestuariirhabdus sp. LZHN29]|uniref:substrate-binding periplasmic protein n=1 Tax=Aestuariirhabdus sp. LZHN29 TaxID=3417462 RepID=UPI003CE9020B
MSRRWIWLVAVMGAAFFSAQAFSEVRPLRVVYANQWAPISYGDEVQVRGILPALVDEIVKKRMGVDVVHRGVPWGRAQSMVRSGSADGFITTPTEARLRYSQRSSETVYELTFRAYSRKGSDIGEQLDSGVTLPALAHYQFCDVLGNSWADHFYGELEIAFEATPVVDNCLKMLSMGRTDLLIHSEVVTEDKILELDLDWSIQRHDGVFDRVEFVLMLSNQSSFDAAFIQRFDKELALMKVDGSYQALIDRVRNEGY